MTKTRVVMGLLACCVLVGCKRPSIAAPGATSSEVASAGSGVPDFDAGDPNPAMTDAAMPEIADAAVPEIADAAMPAIDAGPAPSCERGKYRDVPPSATDDVVILWNVWGPSVQYDPQLVMTEGTNLEGFTLVFDAASAPASSALFAIEDPKTGVQTDPNATQVAFGGIYSVVAGRLACDFEAVNALDIDTVTGQARDAYLFWTPVELQTSAGVRGLGGLEPSFPISPGYHLFVDGHEAPLDSLLVIGAQVGE